MREVSDKRLHNGTMIFNIRTFSIDSLKFFFFYAYITYYIRNHQRISAILCTIYY